MQTSAEKHKVRNVFVILDLLSFRVTEDPAEKPFIGFSRLFVGY